MKTREQGADRYKKKGVELGSIWGVCDPWQFLNKYNVKMLGTSILVEIEVKEHVFEKSIFSIKINMGHINSTGGCDRL